MPAVMNSMCAVDGAADGIHRQFGGVAALVGLAAGAQAAGAQLDGLVRRAARQCLRVGVGADELHALHVRWIMCSTALPPPPPTPITLIWVPWLNSSTSIISMLMCFS
jgi:hypothetical protein